MFVCGYAKCMVWFGAIEISLTYKHILSPPCEVLSLSDTSHQFSCTIWSMQETCLGPWAPLVQGLLLYLLLALRAMASHHGRACAGGSWCCFLGNSKMPRVMLIYACGTVQGFLAHSQSLCHFMHWPVISRRGWKGCPVGAQRWPLLASNNWMLLWRANAFLCGSVW